MYIAPNYQGTHSLDRRRLQTKKVVSVKMQKGVDLGNTAKSFLG